MYPKKEWFGKDPWLGYMEPFHILKGISYVGTYAASVHLIDTGDGLVLIDTGYRSSVYTIVDGIYRLGYKPEDVKYIFLTHWHGDHTEGVAPLLTVAKNAKTVIGIRDDAIVRKNGYFDPDIVVKDGDTLTLGKVTFRFVETPGHTVGVISIFFDYEEEGRVYYVGTFGGAGPLSLFEDNASYYPGARDDYFKSIERLKKEKVDLFIGNHCWNNDTDGKAEQLRAHPETNPFVDDKEFYRFLDFCRDRVLDRMKRENLSK